MAITSQLNSARPSILARLRRFLVKKNQRSQHEFNKPISHPSWTVIPRPASWATWMTVRGQSTTAPHVAIRSKLSHVNRMALKSAKIIIHTVHTILKASGTSWALSLLMSFHIRFWFISFLPDQESSIKSSSASDLSVPLPGLACLKLLRLIQPAAQSLCPAQSMFWYVNQLEKTKIWWNAKINANGL